jgi:hypothetical protein
MNAKAAKVLLVVKVGLDKLSVYQIQEQERITAPEIVNFE